MQKLWYSKEQRQEHLWCRLAGEGKHLLEMRAGQGGRNSDWVLLSALVFGVRPLCIET